MRRIKVGDTVINMDWVVAVRLHEESEGFPRLVKVLYAVPNEKGLFSMTFESRLAEELGTWLEQ